MESQKAREHRLLYLKNWRKRNREYTRAFDKRRRKEDPKIKERQKKYHSENPDKNMEYQRMANYGISSEQYYDLVKRQNNRCGICGRLERRKNYKTGKRQSLSIDHDHASGKNRGLLCRDCNFAIGLFEDNAAIVQKAVQYLRKHNKENNGYQ